MEQILLGSILGISFADDLKSRKVHNWLILGFLVSSLGVLVSENLLAFSSLLSLGVCLSICLPLVYFKVLGAGDLKLFAVLSLFFEPNLFIQLFILSLIWNSIAGVFKFGFNIFTKTQSKQEALKIPFTYGILLAWLSLSYVPQGGLL